MNRRAKLINGMQKQLGENTINRGRRRRTGTDVNQTYGRCHRETCIEGSKCISGRVFHSTYCVSNPREPTEMGTCRETKAVSR